MQWLPRRSLEETKPGLLRGFLKRQEAGELNPYGDLASGIHADWTVVERVIAHRAGPAERFLIKWKGLGYSEATWIPASDLQPADQASLPKERQAIPGGMMRVAGSRDCFFGLSHHPDRLDTKRRQATLALTT